jgi:hypothetical protein
MHEETSEETHAKKRVNEIGSLFGAVAFSCNLSLLLMFIKLVTGCTLNTECEYSILFLIKTQQRSMLEYHPL